jgi:hypothetical protein
MLRNEVTHICLYTIVASVLLFFVLIWDMEKKKIQTQPIIELTALFATYGLLLLVVFTGVFYKWTQSSILYVYLVLCAPILMGVIAYRLSPSRELSKYHNRIYKLAIMYYLIGPIILGVLYFTGKMPPS